MVKLIATDIDGTLTKDRKSVVIPVEVIEYMRKLESEGVSISLVSSNALPIVIGLKKYLGLSGPVIAESGALIYFGGDDVRSLTSLSTREVLDDVLKKFSNYVESTWQNKFRIHDFAIRVRREWRDKSLEIYLTVKKYVESRYKWVKVGFSGYAIHLTPHDVSKGKALKYVINELGLSKDDVMAIGDSSMDLDLILSAGIGVAVSNADEELKRKAKIVTTKPSYQGFIEVAEMVLKSFSRTK